MATKINFQSVRNFDLIKRDVRDVINLVQGNDCAILKRKNWICATLDDKQFFDEDANNLASALSEIHCNAVYYGWSVGFDGGGDFDVYSFQPDYSSIIAIQGAESPLDHMDSIIFGDYPLRFCIFRPSTFEKLLYVIGEEGFVRSCCKEFGWKISCNISDF
ncbi:hypothetical protein [Chromobacterium haemolyticum]|uniref:hypothetical protein n=1 Tax=Chromobacterium haemolyticum TaxID=394935 RepID=UPI00113160A6|nr:hypothetical protein [Chromobacterium haemolyticum]